MVRLEGAVARRAAEAAARGMEKNGLLCMSEIFDGHTLRRIEESKMWEWVYPPIIKEAFMKYKVSGTMTVSCWCEVEANSEKQAAEIASNLGPAYHKIDERQTIRKSWFFDNDGVPEISIIELKETA